MMAEEKKTAKVEAEKVETEAKETETVKVEETKTEEVKVEAKPEAKVEETKAEAKAEAKPEAKVEETKVEETVIAEKEDAIIESFQMVDEIESLFKSSKIEERNGEKFISLEDLLAEESVSDDDYLALEQLYTESLTEIKEGQIVEGRIIAINDKEVAVDIGFKSEGVVPIDEFDVPADLKVGDEIDVYLDSLESTDGQLSLSKRKADFMRVWSRVKSVYAADGIIRGRCVRRIKGGMVVDLGGVDAFLPGSQIDVRPIRDFDAIIATEMEFKILKINDLRKNIVVSHKVLKEESLREVREKLISNLEVNQILEGTVKNITDFGVFVDLGGVDGLLHITDLSWGRVAHPSEIVQLDQKIRVAVLNYDAERKRISLGLKQLYSHLWDEIDVKYQVGQKVQGKVVSLAKYGAFIEIEPGIEGLVHISEMSWTQHVKHPNQVVHENEYVEVVILSIDKENKKISLGLKQVEQDPWEAFESKYCVNTKHKGIVRDLVPFGAFVELEDGVDGLVHISDLSWTRKVRHPGEIMKKGQEVEVVVLSFDRDERRIALGHKQIEENPWDGFARECPVGTKTTGTVVRVIDKGLIIELSHKIEGFMPNSQISRKYFDGKKRSVQIGDLVNLAIVEFDKEERKVILSNSQVEKKEEKSTKVAYSDSGKPADSKKKRPSKPQAPPPPQGPTLADSLDDDNPLLIALKKAQEEEKAAAEKAKKKKTAAKAKKTEAVEEDKDSEVKPAKEKKAAKKETKSDDKAEEAKEEKPKAEKKTAKKATKKAVVESDDKAEEIKEEKPKAEKKTAKKATKKADVESDEKTEAKEEKPEATDEGDKA
jgi:small subunit ribosomal protein S1